MKDVIHSTLSHANLEKKDQDPALTFVDVFFLTPNIGVPPGIWENLEFFFRFLQC